MWIPPGCAYLLCGSVDRVDQCDNCGLFFCRDHFFYFHYQGHVRCLCVRCNLATLSKLSADDLPSSGAFS